MSAVESPCNKVCAIDADGLCLGCRRSLAEIAAWSTASDDQRRAILAAVATRPLRPDR